MGYWLGMEVGLGGAGTARHMGGRSLVAPV